MGAWDYSLFQSDHDFDILSELGHEAGLDKLEEDARVVAKAEGKGDEEVDRIYYTIYRNICSDPVLVRKHLDSGVLVDMIAKKKAKMVAPSSGDTEEFWDSFGRDPCCVYVLLGACAMTLGCQLPDDYITMLKKVYTEGGLMPDAQLQMKKALFGPDSYKTGEPYDFKSKTLEEEANSRHGGEPNSLGFLPMNVLGPGSFFNTGMTTSSTSIVIKELREQAKGAHVCAVCGAKNGYQGTSLLLCSRCKNRKYCSAGCQKQHWKIHKKACEAVTNN